MGWGPGGVGRGTADSARMVGHNTCVLIVMASAEAAERLAAPLRANGYRVASMLAWDGAVEALGHLRFDLAFVDGAALRASAQLYRELAGQTPMVLITSEAAPGRSEAVSPDVRATLDAAAEPDEIVSVARRALVPES